MSEPEKRENLPDESAGNGKGIPNGGNSAKTKEVRVWLQHTADASAQILADTFLVLQDMCVYFT